VGLSFSFSIEKPRTVISNEAGRRFFFHVRSCERVGLRRENSSPSREFCGMKSLFDFSDNLDVM
jgi:hypothetical protein